MAHNRRRRIRGTYAYHQMGGTGKRPISGYFSLKGEEKEVHLHPGAFGCVMGGERLLFRSREEGGTVSSVRVKPVGAVDLTLDPKYTCCLRYLQETEDQFTPQAVLSRLRSHELPSDLRESLETEGRTAAEGAAPKCDRGKMLSAMVHAMTTLMQENASLKAQLLAAVQAAKDTAVKEDPEMPFQDGTEQEGSHTEEPEKTGGASKERARICPAVPPAEVTSPPAAPPSCHREGASSGGEHLPLLPESVMALAAVRPVTTTCQATDPPSAACTTTYRARTRTELQELYE
ncbi:uncharacterized protein LOC109280665 [Alligator mississippiensis]|uniref:uncharacterized protein LOC109280665 n=1 Tax=Alligator mississippiensis TaxID=8496 RepID=UPI0028778D37|nr:uncharacterized protein LOC109280665 [Alligator mississippiensis]XP_059570606.1 uncharacterized protein LOC109280665 [Alligator mississippiensis]